MSKYLIAGILSGISIPFIITDRKYSILYNGIYSPHMEHKKLKQIRRANRECLNEYDYILYLSNVFISFGEMLYELVYFDRYKFKLFKQTLGLYLTANFEFVNETIVNYSQIIKRMENIEPVMTESSYEYMADLEKNYKPEETLEDINLKNIAIMKKNTKDEYQKYSLENSVLSNQEYLSNQNPELKLKTKLKNYETAQMYQNSLNMFYNEKYKDDIFSDLREDNRKIIRKDELNKPISIKEFKSEELKRLQEQANEIKSFIEERKIK